MKSTSKLNTFDSIHVNQSKWHKLDSSLVFTVPNWLNSNYVHEIWI